MAKETVLIGCRLPHGLTITHPDPAYTGGSVTIRGLRDSKIIGATYATTEVDAEFWAAWRASYMDYQPLRTGAIFVARNVNEADGKGKELAKEKTGFEPLDPEKHGVKTADKED